MATPGIGIVNKSFVTAIDPLLDNPDFQQQLIGGRRDAQYLDIMQAFNGKPTSLNIKNGGSVNSSIFYTWAQANLGQALDTTGATIVGSGTASFTVSVLPAGSQGLVKVGDVLYLLDGSRLQVKTVPTAASFTAITVNGTNAVWTAAQNAYIITNSFESGSSAPLSTRWSANRRYNTVMVIRDRQSFTDIERVNPIRFTVNGEDKIFFYETEMLRLQHMKHINGAAWLSQLGTTLFSDSSPANAGVNGRGIQNSMGFDQAATLYGINDSVSSLGTVATPDMEDLVQQIVTARGGFEYILAGSTAANMKYDIWLKNLGSSGASSVRIISDGRTSDFVGTEFNFGEYKFTKMALGLLNNDEVVGYGAQKTPAAKMMYGFPKGMAPAIGGDKRPYVEIVGYPIPTTGGSNRTINGLTVSTITGGLAPEATNGDQTMDIDFVTRMGVRFNNAEALIRQQVLS